MGMEDLEETFRLPSMFKMGTNMISVLRRMFSSLVSGIAPPTGIRHRAPDTHRQLGLEKIRCFIVARLLREKLSEIISWELKVLK